MNKLKFVAALSGVLFLGFPCYAKKDIRWKSKRLPERRTIYVEMPIRAFVEESTKELTLEVPDELGALTITISNRQGNIVYEDAIESGRGLPVSVFLQDLEAGEYVLSLTDGINEMEGDFVL